MIRITNRARIMKIMGTQDFNQVQKWHKSLMVRERTHDLAESDGEYEDY